MQRGCACRRWKTSSRRSCSHSASSSRTTPACSSSRACYASRSTGRSRWAHQRLAVRQGLLHAARRAGDRARKALTSRGQATKEGEMKRALIAAAVAAAGVFVFAAVNATANDKSKKDDGSIHVIEHATTDDVTNGSSTDSAGNVLTFANEVFDAADKTKVGSDQGYCVRIVVGKTWECNWTTFLAGGQMTVEGPFSDTGNTAVAITGGTGKSRNARGWMELNYRNAAGTKFDFIFHLIGGGD